MGVQPPFWGRIVEALSRFHSDNPRNLPGAVFATETVQDGEMVACVGEGWSARSVCNVGSMTKPFTAIAVLLALEENNSLDIELPVCRLPGMEAYLTHPLKSQIKVRDLLQHTSGMPVFELYNNSPSTPCNDPTGPPPCCTGAAENLGPTVPWIGSPGYTNECIFADGRCQPARQLNLDKVSRYVMETYPLRHAPGSEYAYSSANYIVAGRIVEKLTGKSLNIYLKDKLFTPLGMKDSFFIAQPTGDPGVDAWMEEGVTEEQRSRIADVRLITRDGKMPPEVAPGPDGDWDKFRRGWRFVYPDGGMYTTAPDLLTFLRMLRDGGIGPGSRLVLSSEVLDLVMKDHGFGHTMAFGYRGRTTPYGQSPGTLEHLGNIMTYFWYDPRDDDPLLGVFLSQRLANAVVHNNMMEGMKVIFRVFVPMVTQCKTDLQEMKR